MTNEGSTPEFPFVIRRLGASEGGGFLIEYPDLPGCVSDGATPEEAIRNGQDAVKAYLLSCDKHGDPKPDPGSAELRDTIARLKAVAAIKAGIADAESGHVKLAKEALRELQQKLGLSN